MAESTASAPPLTLDGVEQFYVEAPDEDAKLKTLCDLLAVVAAKQVVIRCRTLATVEWMTRLLSKEGFVVSGIHQLTERSMYEGVMNEFRAGSLRILIANDGWPHFVDALRASLVFNYDLPFSAASYILRVGRSDGFDGARKVLNFETGEDGYHRRKIEALFDTQIAALPPDFRAHFLRRGASSPRRRRLLAPRAATSPSRQGRARPHRSPPTSSPSARPHGRGGRHCLRTCHATLAGSASAGHPLPTKTNRDPLGPGATEAGGPGPARADHVPRRRGVAFGPGGMSQPATWGLSLRCI